MARHSLLAIFAALVLAGGIAAVVVKSDDNASANDPVVASSDDGSDSGSTAEPAPAGDDTIAPAPDDSSEPSPAPTSPTPSGAINAADTGVYDDLVVAPDDTATEAAPEVDDTDPVVAIESMPNTGGGLPALLGAGVALGAVATGRRRRD